MKPLEPILVVDLFSQERHHLLDLLSQLSETEWNFPTVCAGWSVKDIALHLFGDDVGLLSRAPDFKFHTSGGFGSWDELVMFINHTNAVWVEATRRISSDLLIKLLTFTGEQLYQRLSTLDLFATGVAVDWAGPDPAPIWLDVAREYTERWLHQQHIRQAVNVPSLTDPHLFTPILEAFVRALPHTYRAVQAGDGTLVKLIISGEAGGEWFLVKTSGGWGLFLDVAQLPQATVTLPQDIAWRLFTKGLTPTQAEEFAAIEGDRSLALPALTMVSIIA